MHAMIRSSRRGLIAAILGVSALLLIVGIAIATAGGGEGNAGESAASDNNATDGDIATDLPLVGGTPTLPVVTDPAPSAKPTEIPGAGGGSSGSPGLPPDAPVSSPPQLVPTDPGNSSSPVTDGPKGVPADSPAVIVPPTPMSPPVGASNLPLQNLLPIPAGSERVEAPIDGLDVAVMESFPPQYLLQIQAGLPSGCAEKAGFEASRSGDVITVKVYNAMPQGATICTMIYGMYDVNLNLGSDFVSGQTYTVVVNDKRMTFTAQ